MNPLHATLLAMLVTSSVASAFPAVGEGGERDNWSWTLVDERGLALGGGGLDADDVRYVHDQGFRAILNYREEFPGDQDAMRELGMEHLLLNNTYAESDTMPLQHVHDAVVFIEENLAAGRPVYVHCTGGWHRSAAGIVAYYMKTNGWRFQQAWDHVAAIRPGIEPRYSEVLLQYEAHLFRDPMLTVDMTTERWDVAVGDTVELVAHVSHNGAPVEGARVQYVIEHRGAGQTEGVTDANGRVTFSFTAPQVDLMQYVHARASKEGFVDGYDRNVYWVKEAKVAAPTSVRLPEQHIVAPPGSEIIIPVSATEGGKPTNVRITMTTRCATHFREYTGWDGRLEARFAAPTLDGNYTLKVHVNRFPAEPVVHNLTLIVGAGGAEPPCEAATPSSPEESSAGANTQARTVPMPWGAGLLAAVIAALVRRQG